MLKVRTVVSVALCLFLFSAVVVLPTGASEDEQKIWQLERDYWRYVQENDLNAYLRLWHKDFLGWPTMSPAPLRKDHITDWITSQTSKGLNYQLVELKPAAIQITGDMAVVYYWVKLKLSDKDGKGPVGTLRVTHTWIKIGNEWQIAGGMSMAETANK